MLLLRLFSDFHKKTDKNVYSLVNKVHFTARKRLTKATNLNEHKLKIETINKCFPKTERNNSFANFSMLF